MLFTGKFINTETAKLLRLVSKVAHYNELHKIQGVNSDLSQLELKIKTDLSQINFKDVDPIVANNLGFNVFDDDHEKRHLLMIPLWVFNYLPDDAILISVNKDQEVTKKDADTNSLEMGYTVYMIEVGSEFEEK